MNRDVTVQEVMDREFVAASESDNALETVELMIREEAEPAIVLRGSEPVGVLSDRDVLEVVVDDDTNPTTVNVGDAMTESVPTITPEYTLAEARDRMAARSTKWLVVSSGGKPDGIVTEHDVLSSSTIGTEIDAANGASEEDSHLVDASTSTTASDAGAAEAGGFEDQGICEKCGSLSRDLSAFNGQLLCADCRDI
ncbi:CBS domain-containing protein [Halomicrobium zhouii]|uniref:CBS domain-containing protein n=1 Tax=Halomicrobium zhouii TaxID=767519 RepID=A0A1I6LQR9_9EURY|nr:CBS domain-containing protein [Halomicrobium zhouii]SFS05814.1 CBS domain-containing protein [Halomicrobium zhouii]